MLVLLTTAAFADPVESIRAEDIACEPAWLSDTLPASGQADVPIDASLTLLFDGECDDSLMRVTLTESWSGNVVMSQELIASAGWTRLTPPDLLAPESAYLLEIEPMSGWGGLVEVPFTTSGEHAVGMADTAPVIDITFAMAQQQDRESYGTEIQLTITPAVDPDSLSFIELYGVDNGTNTDRLIALHGDDAIDVSLGWSSTEQPGEVCFEAVQYDTLGDRITSDLACAPVEVSGWMGIPGCSTAGGMAGLFALIPGLLAAIRRRR